MLALSDTTVPTWIARYSLVPKQVLLPCSNNFATLNCEQRRTYVGLEYFIHSYPTLFPSF